MYEIRSNDGQKMVKNGKINCKKLFRCYKSTYFINAVQMMKAGNGQKLVKDLFSHVLPKGPETNYFADIFNNC